MNVSLTTEMNEWVTGKVKSGQYKSSSEVIRDGLRLLQNKEDQRQAMLEELRHELLIGVKQLDADKSQKFDSILVAQIKNVGRQKLGMRSTISVFCSQRHQT
ncbi:MAG TPA: type II toxin-antitoxin system ParD family antitoxin [Desulfobacterales bacterium]|nr:type II toxin-antitoxin system ParD family antitoxin [Desulfobacterales bacterium]